MKSHIARTAVVGFALAGAVTAQINLPAINISAIATGLEQKVLNGTLSCAECKGLFQVIDIGFNVAPSLTSELIVGACGLLGVPQPECVGLLQELGPTLVYVLDKMTYFSPSNATTDADYLCPIISSVCDYPKTIVPPPCTISSNNSAVAAPSNTFNSSKTPLTILHLSDMHVDPFYQPGTEANCPYYMCCRNETSTLAPNSTSRLASTWGDYQCDAPPKLVDNMLANIEKTVGKKIDFTIFTGDVAPHAVWETTTPTSELAIAVGYNLTKKYLGTVYPAIGNHESSPVNLMPPYNYTDAPIQSKPMYQFLSQQWSQWLPASQVASVVSGEGAYTIKQGNLRIISLNTVMCYVDNFYTLVDFANYDKGGQLGFVNQQLALAEQNGEPVWIISHVAPGDSACGKQWSNAYNNLLIRYKSTIRGQYSGHTHRDELKIHYSDAAQTIPIGFNLLGPSVTTYTSLNPGYRVYTVDPDTFQLIDSKTYIANMSLASTWDRNNSSPQWFLEYSARDYLPGFPANRVLDATFWNQVVQNMSANGGQNALFDMYFHYRGKAADLDEEKKLADPSFRLEVLADIKAGNSIYEASRPDIFKRSVEELSAPALGKQKWWKRELCSTHQH